MIRAVRIPVPVILQKKIGSSRYDRGTGKKKKEFSGQDRSRPRNLLAGEVLES